MIDSDRIAMAALPGDDKLSGVGDSVNRLAAVDNIMLEVTAGQKSDRVCPIILQ